MRVPRDRFFIDTVTTMLLVLVIEIYCEQNPPENKPDYWHLALKMCGLLKLFSFFYTLLGLEQKPLTDTGRLMPPINSTNDTDDDESTTEDEASEEQCHHRPWHKTT